MVQQFQAIGLGQGFLTVAGIAEIVAGLCLLLPRGGILGAVLLTCVMVGALGVTIGHVASATAAPAPSFATTSYQANHRCRHDPDLPSARRVGHLNSGLAGNPANQEDHAPETGKRFEHPIASRGCRRRPQDDLPGANWGRRFKRNGTPFRMRPCSTLVGHATPAPGRPSWGVPGRWFPDDAWTNCRTTRTNTGLRAAFLGVLGPVSFHSAHQSRA